MIWIESLGYLGTVLVAISLMLANIRRLRVVNLAGALVFTGYGLLIEAYPVAALNGFICCVNIYHLLRLYRFKDRFDLLGPKQVSMPLLQVFADTHRQDIAKFFPGYQPQWLQQSCYLILRNLTPVGLFVVSPPYEGCSEVLIDYVTPEVRDFKNAAYLFKKIAPMCKRQGIETLMARTKNGIHQHYLQRIGFEPRGDGFFKVL